jgi:hypothetical protein
MSALRVAVDRWRADASGALQDYVNESFASLRSEILTGIILDTPAHPSLSNGTEGEADYDEDPFD